MMRTLLLVLALAPPAAAGHAADPATVRLLPGWRDGGRHVAALEIALPAEWHTYWRVPGTSGIPPRLDWSGSSNLRDASIVWPHPEVFESFGVRTIGYRGGVVLPVLLTPGDPEAVIDLDLTLSFGICKDICVPAEAAFTATLMPADAVPAAQAPIEAALARAPRAAKEAGVIDATCRLVHNGDGMQLAASVELSTMPESPVAVIEAASRPDLWIGEAETSTTGRFLTAAAPVEAAGAAGPVLDRQGLRLTLIAPGSYVEIEGCRAPG